jgi:hypothetical protein
MSSRTLINIFLLIFALGTLVALLKFTRILDTGLGASWNEGVESLKRIVWEQTPPSELSPTEKNQMVANLDQKKVDPLFCGSAYFPFIPGANWSYRVKSGPESDVVRLGIPAPENGRTYLDGQLQSRSGWTNRTIAICNENKIRLTDLNFLLIFARNRVVTTPCQGGQYNFTLPKDADLVKGNGWLEDGCLNHEAASQNNYNNGTPSEIQENLEVKGKVLGQEGVTVPAGTFTAEKIELTFSEKATLDFWVAQGVGVVRSVYQEKGSNQPAVIQELVGYQIPTDIGDKQPAE